MNHKYSITAAVLNNTNPNKGIRPSTSATPLNEKSLTNVDYSKQSSMEKHLEASDIPSSHKDLRDYKQVSFGNKNSAFTNLSGGDFKIGGRSRQNTNQGVQMVESMMN
jgi:hypothetical protein